MTIEKMIGRERRDDETRERERGDNDGEDVAKKKTAITTRKKGE